MADLSEFEALAERHPQRCVIARVIERLEDTDRENLMAAFAEPEIGHKTISRWLAARGLSGSDQSVRNHRTGECCCA